MIVDQYLILTVGQLSHHKQDWELMKGEIILVAESRTCK